MHEDEDTPAEEDLKATSDSIRHDAERLARMEEAKSRLDLDDPLVDVISRDIEDLIAQISVKGKAERELADEDRHDEPPDSRRN